MRRKLVATACLAVVLAVGGCGSERAGDNTSSSGSGTIRELTPANFGSSMAHAQRAAQTAHIEGKISAGGETFTMSGDVAGSSINDLSMAMTLNAGPGKTISMVFVDRAFYMKASGAALTHDPAKPWVAVSLDDKSNPISAMFNRVLANLDPAKLAKMYASITRLNDLGVEQVNGVQARHYSVTIDTAGMVKAMGLDQVPGVPIKEMLAQLPDTVTSQTWVDAQQRPVKITSGIDGTTTEMVYSRWGQPVHVKAPPSSQVTSFKDLGD